jgi:hypothetical protein
MLDRVSLGCDVRECPRAEESSLPSLERRFLRHDSDVVFFSKDRFSTKASLDALLMVLRQ